MKKSIALFLACGIVLTALLLTGCQMSGNGDEKEQTTRTVVELNENNYWKYFTVSYDIISSLMGSGAVAAGKEIFNGIRTPKNPKWHLSMHHQLQ